MRMYEAANGEARSTLPAFALAARTRLWATAPASGGEASPTTTSVEALDAAAGAGAKSVQTSRKSRPRLREPMLRAATMPRRADVAELVDAHGSGPCGGDPVEVQVLSSASPQLTKRLARDHRFSPIARGRPGCFGRGKRQGEVVSPPLFVRPLRWL